MGRGSVVWKLGWQEEVTRSEVDTDSDWGGHVKDRRSTSGGFGGEGVILLKRGVVLKERSRSVARRPNYTVWLKGLPGQRVWLI